VKDRGSVLSVGKYLQVLNSNYVQLSKLARVCTLCTTKGLEGCLSNDACNQTGKKQHKTFSIHVSRGTGSRIWGCKLGLVQRGTDECIESVAEQSRAAKFADHSSESDWGMLAQYAPFTAADGLGKQ
jgi:hypothetical protein